MLEHLVNLPLGVPRGLLGRVGVALMARGLPQQREIADLLVARAPSSATPAEAAASCPTCSPNGIHPSARTWSTPSPAMRSQATHRGRQWQRAGRVDVSAGTADQLPYPTRPATR